MNPTGILAIALLLTVFGGILYVGHGRTDRTTDTEPARHSCHLCGRLTSLTVRRRDTGHVEPACIGCRDEGTAWGWWVA